MRQFSVDGINNDCGFGSTPHKLPQNSMSKIMENTTKIAKSVITGIAIAILFFLLPFFMLTAIIGGHLVRIALTPMRILHMNPELERDIDNWFRHWGYCPYRIKPEKWRVSKIKPQYLEGYWPLDWYKTKKWYVNREDLLRLHRAQIAYDYELYADSAAGDGVDFKEYFLDY